MSDVSLQDEFFQKAEDFEKNGLLKDALSTYDFILSRYPHAISAYIAKGMIFEYKRMYILALDSYKLALEIDPNLISSPNSHKYEWVGAKAETPPFYPNFASQRAVFGIKWRHITRKGFGSEG